MVFRVPSWLSRLRFPTPVERKTFCRMFGSQLLIYFLFSVNARALAQGRVGWTVGSDMVYAGVVYYMFKMVAKNECPFGQLGYTLGGAGGSGLAILVTKLIFKQ